MSYLYFNEEGDYSEENTCKNLNWYKCGHSKNEMREIDCFFVER